MKVPESLHKAQRQYRHNYGSDELIPAFDFTETIKVVNELESIIEQLQNTSSNSDSAKKPSALEFARICTKEGIDPMTSGLVYNLFFA